MDGTSTVWFFRAAPPKRVQACEAKFWVARDANVQ
jgi:hypothetical protein